MVQSDRLPHALMLLGKSGSGALALAMALANYMVCKDRQTEDSCGVCSSCVKAGKHIHPDIHFAYPVVKKDKLKREDTTSVTWLKEWRTAISESPHLNINRWQSYMGAENSQPNINKKECEEIIHKLGMKSFEDNYKILIIWLPEYLGKEGNRLLKLIEEPSPDTLIIFVAENQEEILNTIISRVQITKVKPYSPSEIVEVLMADHNLGEEQAQQAAVMADGDLGKAQDMLSGHNVDYSEALFSWIRIAYKMEPTALKGWIDEAQRWGREGQKNFIKYGLHFFREYAFWLHTKSTELKLSSSEKETAQKMMQIIDADKAEKLVRLFNELYGHIARNGNPRILLMADSMTISYILRGKGEVESLYMA